MHFKATIPTPTLAHDHHISGCNDKMHRLAPSSGLSCMMKYHTKVRQNCLWGTLNIRTCLILNPVFALGKLLYEDELPVSVLPNSCVICTLTAKLWPPSHVWANSGINTIHVLYTVVYLRAIEQTRSEPKTITNGSCSITPDMPRWNPILGLTAINWYAPTKWWLRCK